MTSEIVVASQSSSLALYSGGDEPSLDGVIAFWLDAKLKRGKSDRTHRAYADTLASYRGVLRGQGLDLDERDVRKLALLAQAWAYRDDDATGKPPAAATVTQRLACVSSFYRFAPRYLPEIKNPIPLVDRPRVNAYESVKSLDETQIHQRLAALDTSTLLGRRDYALLLVALTTGARLSALAGLTFADVERERADGLIVLRFTRLKGNKRNRRKLLGEQTSAALVAYLDLLPRTFGALRDDERIWRALDHANYGKPLSTRGIGVIVQRVFSTTRVHALRHTYAHGLVRVGAHVEEIRDALDHNNLATTSIYVKSFTRVEDPHSAALEALFVGRDAQPEAEDEPESEPARDTQAAS